MLESVKKEIKEQKEILIKKERNLIKEKENEWQRDPQTLFTVLSIQAYTIKKIEKLNEK